MFFKKLYLLVLASLLLVATTMSAQGLCGDDSVNHLERDSRAVKTFMKDVYEHGFNNNSRFSVGNAAIMALLSHSVFTNAYTRGTNDNNIVPKIERVLRAIGMNPIGSVYRGEGRALGMDTDYFIINTDKTVFVVFRGTEGRNLADISTSALGAGARRVSGYAGKVHKGYSDGVDHPDVYNVISERLRRAGSNKEVFVTGHSLGGSLATLFAYKHAKRGKKITAIYALGNPRVGNADFKRDFDRVLKNKAYRIKYVGSASSTTERRDHVTEIPKCCGECILKDNCSYVHVGKFKKVIGARGTLRNVTASDDDISYDMVLGLAGLMEFHHCYCFYFKPLYESAKRNTALLNKIERGKRPTGPKPKKQKTSAKQRALKAKGEQNIKKGYADAIIGTWKNSRSSICKSLLVQKRSELEFISKIILGNNKSYAVKLTYNSGKYEAILRIGSEVLFIKIPTKDIEAHDLTSKDKNKLLPSPNMFNIEIGKGRGTRPKRERLMRSR